MRKCKSISFDTGDEIEEILLQHAERKGNFSRYVKRLIEKDMNGWRVSEGFIVDTEIDEMELETEEENDEDVLNGFI